MLTRLRWVFLTVFVGVFGTTYLLYHHVSEHILFSGSTAKVSCKPPQRTNATRREYHLYSLVSPWSVRMATSKTLTDLTKWDFQNLTECPRIELDPLPEYRTKLSLDCSNQTKMVRSKTNDPSDVFWVNFGDRCLQRAIDSCCSDKKPVPNVVHYVWYNNVELGFFQFLSFMSALRFIRPCLFLIHGEFVPYGKYWNLFIQLSPNVIHVKRRHITTVYGNKLAFKEHGSDVMRIEGLSEYGGVYLDWDQLVLRSLEPLRQYEHTQGLEEADLLGSQLIMSKRNATFLRLWHEGYKHYTSEWVKNALAYPYELSKLFPHMIHIEGYNFTRPNYNQLNLIFNQNYDWSTNYGMHLFIREYKNTTDLEIIRKLNTTIGSVARHVLFGNKELCV